MDKYISEIAVGRLIEQLQLTSVAREGAHTNGDANVLHLSAGEHDSPLVENTGRRTSALCQSHQQRPAGIRHVTCTRH